MDTVTGSSSFQQALKSFHVRHQTTPPHPPKNAQTPIPQRNIQALKDLQ